MSELYLEFTQRELTMEDMEGKKEEIKEIMVTTKRDEQVNSVNVYINYMYVSINLNPTYSF